MLKQLRYQLTFLYLGAGVTFFLIIGAGAYILLTMYFQNTTDLALQYKAAQEFQRYGVSIPPELEKARQSWNNQPLIPFPRSLAFSSISEPEDDETEHGIKDASEDRSHPFEEPDEQFDANLAPIFSYALQENGLVSGGTLDIQYPIPPNLDAIRSAISHGYDWRTVQTKDDTRLRLLTYRMDSIQGPAVIQLGRLLDDQDHLLTQFLIGMLILGLCSSLFLGVTSWWLAGRSLTPAQRAWEQQQDFIANASHELRTPLTVVRAAAEIALRGHPAPQHRTLFQDILQEINHMSNLVENLLLLSRLDAGRMKFDQRSVPLDTMLIDIHRQMKRITDEKGIQLVLEGSGGAVLGDETRIRQVLIILLDNAIRNTRPGGLIRIEASRLGNICRIRILDNGSGIPKEHLKHVFDRFYQIPGSGDQPYSGNGLGLSIAKGLVEGMGGKIYLDSIQNQGAQATIEIIAAPPGDSTN